MAVSSLFLTMGIFHSCFIAIIISIFFYILGACNSKWSEPVPKAVNWAYPNDEEKSWLLQFVSETALKTNFYTTSISQYVGARGTSGSKLMLLTTTFLGTSQIFQVIVLYYTNNIHLSTYILSWISSFFIIVLGFCESALLWDYVYPEFKCEEDVELLRLYRVHLNIQKENTTNDKYLKTRLSIVHTFSALSFIFLQLAISIIEYVTHQRLVSFIFGLIGLGSFMIFCVFQWLTGSNDDMLGHLAIVRIPCLQCFYYPQGSMPTKYLKAVSWMFILTELVSFCSMGLVISWISILYADQVVLI